MNKAAKAHRDLLIDVQGALNACLWDLNNGRIGHGVMVLVMVLRRLESESGVTSAAVADMPPTPAWVVDR